MRITKNDLKSLVVEALKSLGGSAYLLEVSKYIYDNYEEQLRNSGKIFYTWQYDMRWAAHKLRNEGIMKSKKLSKSRMWELTK